MIEPNANIVRAASSKNRKTAAFVERITGWPAANCVEFAVLFEAQIAAHRGADHLIRAIRSGAYRVVIPIA